MKAKMGKLGRITRRVILLTLLAILTRVVLWLTSVVNNDLHKVELVGTSAMEWLPYSYAWCKVEVDPLLKTSQLDLDI